MRSETEPYSTLPPILLTAFRKRIQSYGLKKILFITIKDNTGKGKYQKIGKTNDWIRRYSDTYFIGRGTKGGNHFHMLAGIEKDKTPIPVKGVHFHITDLASKTKFTYDETIAREDRYIKDIMIAKEADIIQRYQIKMTIPNMIKKHFKKMQNKLIRENRITKKNDDIERCIEYIKKNIAEPRESEERFEYLDYIIKPK